MKEIIAIIRPKKSNATKFALEKMEIPNFTAVSVLGRGKQKGLEGEVDIEFRPGVLEQSNSMGMKYVPKRLLSIIVTDADAGRVVKKIIEISQTGQIGDGKIFVCPVDDAIRIRTDEEGDSAIL